MLYEVITKAADVLTELEEEDRNRFLGHLPSEIIAKRFIDNMDSDDAADILGALDEEIQRADAGALDVSYNFV